MNDQLKTDDELIAGMRKGGSHQHAALKQIFLDQSKRRAVIGYLTSKGCSQQDAEDLYQDAIIIFVGKVVGNDYLSLKSIDSYVFNIAKLNWYNKFRQNRKRAAGEIDGRDAIEEDVSKYYDRQERAEILKRVLDKFGERCKRMLLMFSQGYQLSEIAETLKMVDAERARKEKYRCLNRMRKRVQQDETLGNFIKTHLMPDENEF